MKINIELSREEVEAGLDFLARPQYNPVLDLLKSSMPALIHQLFDYYSQEARKDWDPPKPEAPSDSDSD